MSKCGGRGRAGSHDDAGEADAAPSDAPEARTAAEEEPAPAEADVVEGVVELLANAGSLATAGAALIGPLQTLAGWLGAHGAAILGLLAL